MPKKGIYMGGEALKGIASSQIRALADAIKTQQEKFAKQAGKAKIWDLGGDVVQGLLSTFGGVPGIIAGHGFDYFIDQISGKELMLGTRAGDPEAIKKLQTAYTGGGYGEEFEKMLGESRPDPVSGFLQEATEGLKSYALSESLGRVGGKSDVGEPNGKEMNWDWLKNLLPTFGKKEYKAGKGQPQGDRSVGSEPKKPWGIHWEQGGKVPEYYGGGSVSGSPTIVDYFSMQGKTLGGSNTESLAEKLNRRI